MTDLEYLVRDKYHGDASLITKEDTDRLASGEPLAYVIGWIPFLGLQIDLQSKPLIPRPETEW
jgi:methylase of polypeptide subunit release factors